MTPPPSSAPRRREPAALAFAVPDTRLAFRRRGLPRLVVVATLLAAASPDLAAQSEEPPPAAERDTRGYEAVHSALTGARPDGDELVVVEGLGLQREAGRLVFLEGAALPLRAPSGRVLGAVFVGSGRFELRPPSRVERAQLARFHGTDSLSVGLEAAVLFFTDDTWSVLAESGSGAPGPVPDRARDALEESLDFLHDEEEVELDPDLLHAYLNDVDAFLHVHLVPEDGERLYYRVEPDAIEEVTFGRDASGRGDDYEVVSRFHRLSEYGSAAAVAGPASPEDGDRDTVAVTHHEIEAAFDDRLDFSGRATLTLEGTQAPGSWIRFELDPDIQVDSLRWASGTPAEHARREESWSLWVRAPERSRDATRLTIWYRGDDVVEYRRGWYFPSTPAHWYPRLGRSMSTFDVTFRHPDDRDLVAVGKKISSRREDDVVVSRWATDFPAIHASFNLGDYEQYRLTDPRVPPVTLQVNADFHRDLASRPLAPDQRIYSLDRDEIEERVGGDLMNAISFYTSWFGPPPMEELFAAEIPGSHGQAFPGMVHLSWIGFQLIRRSDAPQLLRAHEVAHQWWGLGVEAESYHDYWLGEGLATFASMWYRQVERSDPEDYLDRLEEYRDGILDREGEAGPIWLGTRLYTSETEEDYSLIVYRKGAWVFHMLRNLFLDIRTMEESRFEEMLRDLYARYRGDRLSTEEFRAHVERHAGVDMGWFFDQWVYGTGIPTYRVTYSKEELDGDRHRLRLRVEQEDVPDDFMMSVPVSVRFANDARIRFRMMVQGPVSEMELPPLSQEPEEVTFNILHSVLARVEDDGWVE